MMGAKNLSDVVIRKDAKCEMSPYMREGAGPKER
jgi:hypothetical protein